MRAIDDAITVRQGLPPKVYVPPHTLLRWREQYRALLQDEIEFRYDTTMAGAITTIGHSLYGLMIQDATEAIIDTAAKANKETDSRHTAYPVARHAIIVISMSCKVANGC